MRLLLTKKKVVKTWLESIYSTDVFDTLKNGKLRSSAPIIPQSPARLQEETFWITYMECLAIYNQMCLKFLFVVISAGVWFKSFMR